MSSSKTIICVCMIPPVAEMFLLVWSVVEALELYDIPGVSLANDWAKPNRFFHLCHKEKTMVPHKTDNPYKKTDLCFCDPPHLLKTARNCFSNSFVHSKSRKMVSIIQMYICIHVSC